MLTENNNAALILEFLGSLDRNTISILPLFGCQFLFIPQFFGLNLLRIRNKDCVVVCANLAVAETITLLSSRKFVTVSEIEPVSLEKYRELAAVLFAAKAECEFYIYHNDFSGKMRVGGIHDCGLSLTVSTGNHSGRSITLTKEIPILSGLYFESNVEFNQCSSYAFYDILSSIAGTKSSSVNLQLKWNGLEDTKNIAGIVQEATVLIFYISRQNGDTESHENSVTIASQLEKLKQINENIMTSIISNKVSINAAEKFERLISHIRSNGYKRMNNDVEVDDFVTKIERTTDLDFIDLFWDYLMDLDLNEFGGAMSLITKEIMTGKFQPLIGRADKTVFAETIREWLININLQTAKDSSDKLEGLGSIFESWTQNPLEIALEIGMSQLTKDFIWFFVGQHLSSMKVIEPFISSDFEIDQRIDNLLFLQSVLETVNLLTSNILSTPLEFKRELTSKCLASNCRTGQYMVELPLPSFNSGTKQIIEAVTNSSEPLEVIYSVPECQVFWKRVDSTETDGSGYTWDSFACKRNTIYE